ncbi:hypothetical protein [Paludisphaera sp.]|uniref:hypothetical protein n=1 Tax=Paludisphaera sp. TaxID=2017432 RepID=UPI00301BB250
MTARSRWLAGIAAASIAAAGGTAGAQATSTAPTVMFGPSGQAVMVDPLMTEMMMGTGVPLTRGQAGLAAASTVGNMTGIGSGRASGTRGVATRRGTASVRETAGRRPTLGTPAGQASSYFGRYGRGTSVNVSSPAARASTGRYYNRPAGFFPEGVQ